MHGNRRQVTAALVAIPAGCLLQGLPQTASPFIPFLLRILLQGAFRTTVSRTVTTTAVRALAAGATRTVVTTFRTVGSLGISATGLASVSAAVWAMASEYKVRQIWVAGSGVSNNLSLASDKATTELERVFVGYRVIDANTGELEKRSLRMASSRPGSQPFVFPFEVRDLPFPGLKRIEAFVSLDKEGMEPHPGFLVDEPQTILVAHPTEVAFG